MKNVETKFLLSVVVILFLILLGFVIEGVVRATLTANQANIPVTTQYQYTNDMFTEVKCDNILAGYLLKVDATTQSSVGETEFLYSSCNVVSCADKIQMEQIITEWSAENNLQGTLYNISNVKQLYNKGYVCYYLADTDYKLGNKTYTIPFWSILVIQPFDIQSDGTYTRVSVTTLRNKISNYDSDLYIDVLTDFFALYSLDLNVVEFLSVTDNNVTYQPAIHFAYTDEKYFEFDSVTGTILEYRSQDKDAPTEVYIPETIYGTTVRAIGDNAFYKYNETNNISVITMPDTITEIGDRAFMGCTSLENIKLSDNLSVVGNEAFAGCTALVEIQLPHVLQKLSADMFLGCTQLKIVDGLEQITECYYSTFEKCTMLESKIPTNCIIHT